MQGSLEARGATREVEAWSPARVYLVVSGILLVVLAAAGFAVNAEFPTEAGRVAPTSGHIFGILETNGWHNLAGVLSAVVAFGFAARPEWSRTGALVKGVFYVGVTSTIAIFGGETFWIAANTADQVIHASLAAGGLATAALTPR